LRSLVMSVSRPFCSRRLTLAPITHQAARDARSLPGICLPVQQQPPVDIGDGARGQRHSTRAIRQQRRLRWIPRAAHPATRLARVGAPSMAFQSACPNAFPCCDRRRTASPCSPCMPRTVCSEAHVLDTDDPPIRFARLHPSALEPTAPSLVPSTFRIDCARRLAGLAKWPAVLHQQRWRLNSFLPPMVAGWRSLHSTPEGPPTSRHVRFPEPLPICWYQHGPRTLASSPSQGAHLLRASEAHQTSTASSRPNHSVGKFGRTHTHTHTHHHHHHHHSPSSDDNAGAIRVSPRLRSYGCIESQEQCFHNQQLHIFSTSLIPEILAMPGRI
jgi:hypothetical protein